MSETKVPALPAVSDTNLTEVVRAVKQTLDVREGRIGDPLDANVTYRDLVSIGAVTVLPPGQRGGQPVAPIGTDPDGYDPTKDFTQPPAPTDFTVTGGFAIVQLQWTAPSIRNLAYTEIWRGETNALGNAVLIGTSDTRFYTDNLGSNATRYYWARHVSQANVFGPYNATLGTAGTTATNPALVLASLSGQINESELAIALKGRIDLIDADTSVPGSVNSRLAVIQAQVNDLSNTPPYASGTTYSTDDLVTYNGGIYRAKQTTTGNLPTNTTYWEKIGDYTSLGAAVAAHASQIGTLTTDLAAEVTARETLSSTVNNPTTGLAATRSTLINDYYTRTATDSAIASSASVLTTTFNNQLAGYTNTATLTANYYTKTATDAAISQASTTLTSNFNTTLTGYVTNASLTTNYYTKSATDSAISAATTNLVSSTTLSSTLASYVTNASLTTNYYTKTQTDSAISSATSTLVSTTTLNNSLANYTTTAALQTNYYTKTQTDSAISTANTTLQSSINNQLTNYATTASLSTEATTRANADNSLFAQYTVKTDLAGRVAGFGLASSSTVAGGSTSAFAVIADRFSISAPNDYVQETTPTSGVTTGKVWYKASTNQTFRYNGTTWVAFSPISPFIVQTTPTTAGGVSVPAGIYMDAAFIQEGTITNAKIANAAIDNAKIANLDAAKITTGFISADRIESGTIDAKILTVAAAKITGTLTANQINGAGLTVTGGSYTGYNWPASGTGFFLGSQGLLMGRYDANNPASTYFQFDTATGALYMNSFSVVSGVATFSGNLAVTSANSGARMEINNSVIRVIDGNGVVRVKIGNLE